MKVLQNFIKDLNSFDQNDTDIKMETLQAHMKENFDQVVKMKGQVRS